MIELAAIYTGIPNLMADLDRSIPTAVVGQPDKSALHQVDRYMHEAIASLSATPAREAALYHLQTGGNKMRARLAIASGAITLDARDGTTAAAACELLHNASLVHDDISDQDRYRRGELTVQARYGVDVALCTGTLLLTAAFNAATDIHDADTSRHLVRALAMQAGRVIGGQSVELGPDPRGRTPNRRHYLKATRAKTAPLIELPMSVGFVGATGRQAEIDVCRTLSEAIGLAYQILDDLDDVKPTRPGTGAEQFHVLHAWRHHQPPNRDADSQVIFRRCLTHVGAALARADRLAIALPKPLDECVRELIETLTRKAERAFAEHAGRISGGD